TPAGASVFIQVDRQADGDRFRITIRDQGTPIENLALAFDFSGLGNDDALNINALGVTIAQRLVTLLGGAVNAANHAGGGLEVELAFPERPA
ncbi:ATP-binding protein, partial [Staphylococcus aureus]|uniref:ATP-binding protein n=1 Tax=Staphylococcus aureus TaxID=1280 RepID=UPI00301D9997